MRDASSPCHHLTLPEDLEMPRTEPDDPEKLAQVARDYYINDLSQRDIAGAIGVNQSTVAHWLQRARDRGVVAIDIDPDFALSGVEHRDRSRQLRDQFGLRECLVVDPGHAGLYGDSRSDKLHTVIANTSGLRLREWIQSGDHVLVGGGRAPVRVARFIKRTPPTRREVRISPLSGRIWTGSWQEDGPDNLQRPLDADDVARLLGFAFEHEAGTRFSQIGHALYAENIGLARATIQNECVFRLGGGWNLGWGIQTPVRALVGVGVLHPRSGHRMNELLNTIALNPQEEVAAHLRWAAARYREAMDFVESKSLPYFGDVANRLFPVVPLPRDLAKSGLPDPAVFVRLGAMLEELNSRAVVMGWNHLRGVPDVWAVAGGSLKVEALWTLLICRRFEPSTRTSVIKELSTDLKSAELLQQALRDFEKSSSVTQAWYEQVAPTIFPSCPPDAVTKPVPTSGRQPVPHHLSSSTAVNSARLRPQKAKPRDARTRASAPSRKRS
jgi:transposase-like protein